MDAQVAAAMARWPDVPDVYGWLQLDERGRFRLRADGDGGARFETIGNAALNAFIGRNYQSDARGRWYFQNGPQRVFVRLALTPWVFRFDSGAVALAHTGIAARRIDMFMLDERATPILLTDIGPGVVDDRDFAQTLERMSDADGRQLDDERLQDWLSAPGAGQLHFSDGHRRLPVRPVMRATLPKRFGYDPDPAS